MRLIIKFTLIVIIMRRLVFLIFVSCLVLSSCKKEQEYGVFTFAPYFAHKADTTSYDSAFFLIVNYSTADELKMLSEILDSTTYHHTLKLSLDKFDSKNWNYNTININWKVGNYIIKKYDLVDESGKVIYYIPYKIPKEYVVGYGSPVVPLPFEISIGGNKTSYSHCIIKR